MGPRLRQRSAPSRSRWPTASGPGGSTSASFAGCAERAWRRLGFAVKVLPGACLVLWGLSPAPLPTPPRPTGTRSLLPRVAQPSLRSGVGAGEFVDSRGTAGRQVPRMAGSEAGVEVGQSGGDVEMLVPTPLRGGGLLLPRMLGPKWLKKGWPREGRAPGGTERPATRGLAGSGWGGERPLTLPAPQCVSCTFTSTVCPSPAATAASATGTGTGTT